MPSPIQTQVSAGFSPNAGALQLLIEPDPSAYADLDVHLLLFPNVDANLATSAGSVRAGSSKTVSVPPGIVTFSGGSAAQLPKIPSESNPEFKTLYSFDTNGNPTPIGVEFDRETGELRASAECFAAISYTSYKTRARELIYTPLVERLGVGVRTTFGVIAAFYPPRSQTIYQVPPFDVKNGQVEVEVYRIVSYSVTNQDGEFEFPPGYPADGSYPGKSFVFDTSNSLQTERVHEIGYMNADGFAWVRPHSVPTLEPYVGDTAYAPTRHCKVSLLPADLFDEDKIAKAANFVKSRGYGCKGSSGA